MTIVLFMISGFVYQGKKFWEGHTTSISSQGFHAQFNFWRVNSRRQDAQGSNRSKRRFSFYLAIISYANSTCRVGEDVDDSCPPNFFHNVSRPVLSSRPSPIASNLGISFFPSYRFEVAVKGNSIVFETYVSPRRKDFSEVSYLRNMVTLK